MRQLLLERLKRFGVSPSALVGGESADGDWLPESRGGSGDEELDWESLAHLTRGADPLGVMTMEARELLWADHDFIERADKHGEVEPAAVALPPTDEQLAEKLGSTVPSIQHAEARALATIAENIARARL